MTIRKCDSCNKILTQESDYFTLGDIDFHKGKSDTVRVVMTDEKGSKSYDLSESWSDWKDIHFCPECFKKETISRFVEAK